MSYGHIGSMKTLPGRRDEVVDRLTESGKADLLPGCLSYIVGLSETDPDVIWVTEVWESKESHAASLQIPEVKDSISGVLPLLTGEFSRQETTVVTGI